MKKRVITFFLSLLLMLCGWAVAIPSEAYAAFDGIIRVRVSPSGQSSDIRVVPHGNYFISEAPNVRLSDTEYKVHMSGSNVQLLYGQTVLYTGTKITLVRAAGNTTDNFIVFPYSPTHKTRTNYYGDIVFSVNSGLCAVNYVYVEDYVMGVIPYEMSPSWPAEALKAQAVCARNYGVKAALASPSGTWHLGDTASSQVYKGIPGVSSTGTINYSTYNTIKNIVNGVPRKVMKYNGDIFSAYFSAWNGGETLSVKGWTGNTSSAYGYTVVKADVYDDRRCQSAYWISKTINTNLYSPTGNDINMAIQNMLVSKYRAQYGVTASNVYVVSTPGIKGLDPAGAPEVSLVYEKFYCDVLFNTESAPKRITFTDTDLKAALGISSAYIAFRIKNNSNGTTTLYNVRYGHGVGLSQRGAQQMANEGKTYADILNFYYNGITFGTLSVSPPTLPQMPSGSSTPTPTLTPTPTPSSTATPAQSYIATIVNCTSYVNVRSAPNTSSTILGQAPKGAVYPVKKANYTSDWHQIEYNGQTAYLYSYYAAITLVSAASPSPAPTPTATPKATPTATAKPTATPFQKEAPKLTAAPASYNSIKLSWKAVSGATGYSVYRAASAAGPYSRIVSTASTSYVNTNLKTGTTCYYKVAAYALSGTTRLYGSTSSAVSAKPLPGTPASLKAASATATSIKLTWNAVSGATGYSVYRAASAAGPYSRIVSTAKNSYTNTGLKTGTAYYYKVAAYTLVGKAWVYGGFSAAASAKPGQSVKSAPAAASTVYTATIINCNSYVNVRSAPNTAAKVLGKAPKGAKYPVKKANYTSGWHQINYNGATAYVSSQYAALTK